MYLLEKIQIIIVIKQLVEQQNGPTMASEWVSMKKNLYKYTLKIES